VDTRRFAKQPNYSQVTRLSSEQKIAVDEQQLKQLQDSITANNQANAGQVLSTSVGTW
jgi:hypothetical protein